MIKTSMINFFFTDAIVMIGDPLLGSILSTLELQYIFTDAIHMIGDPLLGSVWSTSALHRHGHVYGWVGAYMYDSICSYVN